MSLQQAVQERISTLINQQTQANGRERFSKTDLAHLHASLTGATGNVVHELSIGSATGRRESPYARLVRERSFIDSRSLLPGQLVRTNLSGIVERVFGDPELRVQLSGAVNYLSLLRIVNGLGTFTSNINYITGCLTSPYPGLKENTVQDLESILELVKWQSEQTNIIFIGGRKWGIPVYYDINLMPISFDYEKADSITLRDPSLDGMGIVFKKPRGKLKDNPELARKLDWLQAIIDRPSVSMMQIANICMKDKVLSRLIQEITIYELKLGSYGERTQHLHRVHGMQLQEYVALANASILQEGIMRSGEQLMLGAELSSGSDQVVPSMLKNPIGQTHLVLADYPISGHLIYIGSKGVDIFYQSPTYNLPVRIEDILDLMIGNMIVEANS
ncbi:hypothetical protein KC660_02355 [Candidatus Dojkabacteria bacterium]|uniref:Uncharacterized protein n=1 Tax=Candidatus Dojkabacteria bacterium TaxID=2099670 RepID=A0A955RHY3_9BACT|nr:hypothetical protein [Candidatus Dojkabacteria bacterium]